MIITYLTRCVAAQERQFAEQPRDQARIHLASTNQSSGNDESQEEYACSREVIRKERRKLVGLPLNVTQRARQTGGDRDNQEPMHDLEHPEACPELAIDFRQEGLALELDACLEEDREYDEEHGEHNWREDTLDDALHDAWDVVDPVQPGYGIGEGIDV